MTFSNKNATKANYCRRQPLQNTTVFLTLLGAALLCAFALLVQTVFLNLYLNLLLVTLLHPPDNNLINTSDDLLSYLASGHIKLVDVYNWIQLYVQRNPDNTQALKLGTLT